MTDSYVDLTLAENDIKLKAVDLGDDTYALAVSANLEVGDTVSLGSGVSYIGQVSLDAGTEYIGQVALDAGTAQIGEVTLGAGEEHIGSVGSEGITISQTPTVTVSGAYTANDALGGLLTFADAARSAGKGGVLKDVIIIDDAGQDAATELWLFSDTITPAVDNAAFVLTQPDIRKVVAIVSSADGTWRACGTPSVNRIETSQRYHCVGTSLYGQLVTRGTPTETAIDDITVILGILQD